MNTRALAGGISVVITTLALGAAFCASAAAATLPAGLVDDNRSIDWSNSGVPGGIPFRATIFRAIDAATYGNGSADASAAIQNALNSCPEQQVVYLPPGTYRLNSTVSFNFKRNVTLRGAGPGKTILRPQGSIAGITSGQTGMSAERRILGGSSKGSRSITVDNAAGIQAGTVLDLYQANDPDFYWSRGGSTDRTGQCAMVTAVNGTALQLQDPLVWNLSLNPRFRFQPTQGMNWCGIEDLTMSADSSYSGDFIEFWNAYASWLRNVETAWGNGNCHIQLFGCLRCEIRDSYIHDTYSTSDGYGILTVKSSAIQYGRGGTTASRIENNIFSGLWHAMILETEVASVIAYNYSRNIRYTGWPNYQVADFNSNHGEHGMMNLFEGNIGDGYQADGYHGSISHVTLFRNWLSGQHVDANRTGNIKTVDLCRFSYYHNLVGNVLGNANWPRSTIGRYEMTGMPGYPDQTVIYRLGYPNPGNNSYSLTNPPSAPSDDAGYDPKVKATLLRWGNFDYQTNATRWDPSEVPPSAAMPSTKTLPPSFYLATKPAWWGNAVWPPIGPDVPGLVNKIPAQLRYEGGATPPPAPSDRTAPTVALTAPAGGATLTGSATLSANAGDNVGVAGVQFQLDGENLGVEDTSAPYSMSWNTNTVSNGAHALRAIARDAAGNRATSASVSVTVSNVASTVAATLFTTQRPALLHNTDGAGVNYELGMRFTSTAAGQITAIRFWKDSSETGTHTGRIWSAGGNLLASVVFSGETASGWQRQALASPLSISANTEYLVSVNTGNTYYVATNNGLATAISNGSLKSIVGSNGRYGSPGKYPTQSWQASNYFRDVEFTASAVAPSNPAAYSGVPMAIPGTVPVATYDRGGEGVAYHDNTSANFMSSTWRPGEGVDVGNAPGDGMGWIQAGEWASYTVNVSAAGTYTLSLPVCHPGAGGTFHIEFNGVNKTGAISVPNTGSWEVDQTVSKSVSLSAGTQVMKIVFDTNGSTGFVCGIGDVKLVSIPIGTG